MKRLKLHLILGPFVLVFCWAVGGSPARTREARLVVHAAHVTPEAGEYALLPKPESLRDGDAVPLYEKAMGALPADAPDLKQMGQWLELPPEQFPLKKVEAVLQQHMESLRVVAQAARSSECNWPAWRPGMNTIDDKGYRTLTFVLRLWARFETVQGRYEGSLLAMQTGFGMAHHLGRGPTIMQALVGAAAAAATCGEVEQFVQGADAPNLSKALATLPKPFIDVERVIASEMQAGGQGLRNRLTQKMTQNQLKQAHDRVRVIAKRLDSHVAALQCVEAIRAYAASHDGQLPPTLDSISEVPVPDDPAGGRPFRYTQTGSGAVLESAIPEGGDMKDGMRYEMVLKR